MRSLLQWKRVCQVDIGRASGGEHLRIDERFKIEFEIVKTIGRTPNTALIKVYNLSQSQEKQIRGEFDDVVVTAGYEGDVRLLFRGNIRHTTAYRRGPDRIIEIDAADGDKDFSQAIVNTTIAPGGTTDHVIDAIASSFKTTKKGHVQVAQKTFIRGRVLFGDTRDVLDNLARANDANWSIQDGYVQIVRADSTLPTEAILLSAATGLMDPPEVDDKGIKTKCLLNPRIAINGKVKIDDKDIKLKIKKQRESKPGSHTKSPKKKRGELARLDPDGVYKTYKIKHKGDTRGPDWFTEANHVSFEKTNQVSADVAARADEIDAFLRATAAWGISRKMIEDYLGHSASKLTVEEAERIRTVASKMKTQKVSFEVASRQVLGVFGL